MTGNNRNVNAWSEKFLRVDDALVPQAYTGTPPHRAWPRRSHALAAAVCFTAFAIHGSLVPYDFEPRRFSQAAEQFINLAWAWPHIGHLVDWATNVALFVPISFFWSLGIGWRYRRVSRRIATVAATMVACVALSVSIEFAQLFITARIPSSDDVYAQLLGALAGLTLWWLSGQQFIVGIRRRTAAEVPESPGHRLLQAYLVGLLLYSLTPFDLSLHPAELYRKYKADQVDWRIRVEQMASANHLPSRLSQVAMFVPVGCWASGAWRGRRRRRSVSQALILGAACAIAVEGMQLFIGSRFSTTADVITGTTGVALGILISKAAQPAVAGGQPAGHSRHATRFSRNIVWTTATLAYAGLLCVVFWWPLELNPNRQAMQTAVEGFFRIPFSTLLHKTPPQALGQVLYKLGLFVPLGLCVGRALRRDERTSVQRRWDKPLTVAACVAFAVVLEVVQAAFPPHIPDVSDACLYAGGAALGLLIISPAWANAACAARR